MADLRIEKCYQICWELYRYRKHTGRQKTGQILIKDTYQNVSKQCNPRLYLYVELCLRNIQQVVLGGISQFPDCLEEGACSSVRYLIVPSLNERRTQVLKPIISLVCQSRIRPPLYKIAAFINISNP